ncbi:hypothetical protein Lal_00044958 [Lupinus albus]|nr:hypothetical protein Lal_00044958 [Lupinus albus]
MDVLCLLPVLPPELRPIIQIDGSTPGNYHVSEKLVQEAVDTLLDNGIRGQPMRDVIIRLQIVSDLMRQRGRFRETLLGKRLIIRAFCHCRSPSLHYIDTLMGSNAVHVPYPWRLKQKLVYLCFSYESLSPLLGSHFVPTQDMLIGFTY